MLNDFTGADRVYIACGYTDLRKGIDGLAAMVQQEFELDPFTNTLFLFCGRRRDRIKGLYWEQDGFILLYKRLEQEKPVLDAMQAWANTRNAAPKSKLGIALNYLKNQWTELNAYLQDGRIELSNNRAERSIKPFVISRKNFLFANTPGGARCSAILFSLIETAKENGLDPYRYLTWVLTESSKRAAAGSVWAVELVPQHAPPQCKATSDN